MTDLSRFRTGFSNIVESLILPSIYSRDSDILLQQGIYGLLGSLLGEEVITINEFKELKKHFYLKVQGFKKIKERRKEVEDFGDDLPNKAKTW